MVFLQQIKAMIFDFDGTLAFLNIDFICMRECVLNLVKQFGVKEGSIGEKYILEIIDEVYQILWRRNSSRAEKFFQEAHQILYEIELKAAKEGRLIPKAAETLKVLRGKGIKVGIVTRNCEDAVRKVFPNIDDYCDVFISRNSIKKVKPHPDHLTSVMKALNVSGEEAAMIGDHIIDIQAGKRVGMKTIGVLTGRIKRGEFEKAGADYVLEEVSEILTIL
jgi:phosphoglycolate phosphatase